MQHPFVDETFHTKLLSTKFPQTIFHTYLPQKFPSKNFHPNELPRMHAYCTYICMVLQISARVLKVSGQFDEAYRGSLDKLLQMLQKSKTLTLAVENWLSTTYVMWQMKAHLKRRPALPLSMFYSILWLAINVPPMPALDGYY